MPDQDSALNVTWRSGREIAAIETQDNTAVRNQVKRGVKQPVKSKTTG